MNFNILECKKALRSVGCYVYIFYLIKFHFMRKRRSFDFIIIIQKILTPFPFNTKYTHHIQFIHLINVKLWSKQSLCYIFWRLQ